MSERTETSFALLALIVERLSPDRLSALLECSLTASLPDLIASRSQFLHANRFASTTCPMHSHALLAEGSLVTGVLRDVEALRGLLGSDWKEHFQNPQEPLTQSQWFTLSFVLRHAATWVAWSWRAQARGLGGGMGRRFKVHADSPYGATEALLHERAATFLRELSIELGLIPQLALSARGIEWALLPPQKCLWFDPYAPELCHSLPLSHRGVCSAHIAHDWGDAAQDSGLRQMAAMRQSTLFGFYGNFANLHTYSEEELQHLVQEFWSRMRSAPRGSDLEVAANALGYKSVEDALGTGVGELKNRFRTEARRAHPDAGGEAQAFQRIEQAYRTLLDAMNP